MLLAADEVETRDFIRAYMPRFSAHLYRLRKAGWTITQRPCRDRRHRHEGTSWLYRIEAAPYDPTAGGAE